MIISRLILLKMKNVSNKSCRENQKSKHILCSVRFVFENCSVCEIMWKSTVKSDWLQMILWRIRIACWILKATNTLPEYMTILISNNPCTYASHC